MSPVHSAPAGCPASPVQLSDAPAQLQVKSYKCTTADPNLAALVTNIFFQCTLTPSGDSEEGTACTLTFNAINTPVLCQATQCSAPPNSTAVTCQASSCECVGGACDEGAAQE